MMKILKTLILISATIPLVVSGLFLLDIIAFKLVAIIIIFYAIVAMIMYAYASL